jgi:hypothetical protein
MNPFTLFKLIQLDTKLAKHLEKIILTFYLSFGTAETKMIRKRIMSLNVFKHIIKGKNQDPDNLTLWRFDILRRSEKCDVQYYNWKYGTPIKHHIYYAFVIILLKSDMSNLNEDIMKEQIDYFQKIMNNLFKTKQTEMCCIPNNVGTPSALVMRDHIQIFTLHRKKDLNEYSSLWKLRIMMNWGSENKLCDMRDVCSESVYSDLVSAYNKM